MMTFLLYARGLLFFEPYFAFQISEDLDLSFVLIVIASGLTGLVSSITLYQILMQKAGAKRAGSGMVGSDWHWHQHMYKLYPDRIHSNIAVGCNWCCSTFIYISL